MPYRIRCTNPILSEGNNILRQATPQHVKALGYGFTAADAQDVWVFPSEAQAKAKCKVLAAHFGGGNDFAAEPHPEK